MRIILDFISDQQAKEWFCAGSMAGYTMLV